jgi:ABC-type multidrug transport system ATPase subunit
VTGRDDPMGDPAACLVMELTELAIDTRRRRIGPFDLQVAAGQIVGLVGPNGSGKTSLIRLALGLDPATRGTSRIHGQLVGPFAPPVGVGLLLEADGCYPWASGRDNLALFATALGRRPAEVDELLEQVGLAGAANQPVRQYSRGMRQRLALARARLGRPDLLVLDEPTVALDDGVSDWLVSTVVSHAASGGAAVVASHDRVLLERLGATLVSVDRGRCG